MVTVVTLKENGEITKDKEFQLLSSQVNEVIWSPDGTRLIAVGAGTEIRANAVTFDTGSKCGTILGITCNQLCSDLAQIEKKFTLFSAGEGNEIIFHEGIPFKGQGT